MCVCVYVCVCVCVCVGACVRVRACVHVLLFCCNVFPVVNYPTYSYNNNNIIPVDLLRESQQSPCQSGQNSLHLEVLQDFNVHNDLMCRS